MNAFLVLCTLLLCCSNFPCSVSQEPQFEPQEILSRPRFFKFRRTQLDNPIQALPPINTKPSFASILSSKVVVVKQTGEDDQENKTGIASPPLQESALPADPPLQANGNGITPTSAFVPTSGIRKVCKVHSDCYGLREPDEWCPLPAKDQYIDKGCYCKDDLGICAIEKISKSNGVREFTDCSSVTTSLCVGNKKFKAG